MSSPITTLPDIYQTYTNKHVFVTGGSGFLGKVLLYKMLKEFPEIGSITLLMRAKKGKKAQDRIEGEVLSSLCFDGLKQELGPQEWKRRTSKIRVAVGDVMNDGLGLSQDDIKWITENVSIILHLAATVNFQEKLPISVQMNVLGSLRVLAIAKKCRNLEALVHTSTCYVNYNRHGKNLVKEQIYPLPFDPEQMCRLILGLHEKDVPRQTAILLKKYGFPNTYTFTKNMAEQLIQKMKGSTPVTIVRPSIVGCSLREPYPGWVDVLTAAGGILLTTGLGLTHELTGNPENIADIVPVDYVVNTILKVGYKTSVQFKYGTIRLSGVAAGVLENHAPQAGASSSSSSLVEKNLRRIASSPASGNATKGSGQLVVSGGGGASTQSNTQFVENLKISSYAESNSGSDNIRPSSGAHQTGNGVMNPIVNQRPPTTNPLKAALEGSEAASSSSSDSNETTTSASGVRRLPFVFQSGTSGSLAPLTWDITRKTLCEYCKQYPFPRTFDKPYIDIYPNPYVFEANFFLKRKLPFYALQAASKIPGAMSEKQKSLLKKLARVLYRVNDLNFQFKPFTTVEWRYDSKNSPKYLDDGMAPKARAAFGTDLYDIDWRQYIEFYGYGLVRYFMKVKDNRPVPSTPGSSTEKFMRSML